HEHRALFGCVLFRFLEARVLLRQRAEEERAYFAARVGHLEVRENANNLKHARVLRRVAKSLADGILVGKEMLHEGLIDNHHRSGSGGVLLGKVAAADDWHAKRIEKVRAGA